MRIEINIPVNNLNRLFLICKDPDVRDYIVENYELIKIPDIVDNIVSYFPTVDIERLVLLITLLETFFLTINPDPHTILENIKLIKEDDDFFKVIFIYEGGENVRLKSI